MGVGLSREYHGLCVDHALGEEVQFPVDLVGNVMDVVDIN